MNEEENFTEEQKEELLLIYGYKKFVGYPMGYEAPEAENIIVTVEEVRKWVGEPAQKFYMADNDEWMRDLEDAWECLIDSVYCQLDTDDEKQVDAYLLNKLLATNKEPDEREA